MIVGAADPGRPAAVGRPAHQVHRPRRLHVREAEPRRAAQVERCEVQLGEAGQHGVACLGAAEGSGQRGQDTFEHRGVRLLRRQAEVAAERDLRRLDEGERVLGRGSAPGVGQRGSDHLGDALGAHDAGPARRADGGPGDDDDVHGTGAVHPVGRRRVQGEADVGMAVLLDQHDAPVGAGCTRSRHAVLDQLLGRDHRPDSSRALRIRTPRTSTDGQPCDTGATWPGCPLPQLNAPPSTQVDAPPTASMAPQKSVVVA